MKQTTQEKVYSYLHTMGDGKEAACTSVDQVVDVRSVSEVQDLIAFCEVNILKTFIFLCFFHIVH